MKCIRLPIDLTRALFLLMTASVAACTTANQMIAFRNTETQLQDAREQAWVTCSSRAACDQIWNRTRLYVQLYSRTRISRLNASVIETEAPHESGIAYFWAERTTDDSGTTTIRLKGMCRGMYASDGDPAWTYGICADQIRRAEMNFRGAVGEVQCDLLHRTEIDTDADANGHPATRKCAKRSCSVSPALYCCSIRQPETTHEELG